LYVKIGVSIASPIAALLGFDLVVVKIWQQQEDVQKQSRYGDKIENIYKLIYFSLPDLDVDENLDSDVMNPADSWVVDTAGNS
jgi:hypothetical protein